MWKSVKRCRILLHNFFHVNGVPAERMLGAHVFLPLPEDFPDRYDGSEDALSAMFARVAKGMRIDPASVQVNLFDDTVETTRSLTRFGSGSNNGAGGLYWHTPDGQALIEVKRSQLKDPLKLVAVLAHELCHVILLRPGLVGREEPDMEPLTDLATVFLGFGVFSANAAFQFSQFTNNESQGWSVQRSGYLPEQLFAYALARFAFERGEAKPAWAKELAPNITAYFKKALVWLQLHATSLYSQVERGL